MTPPSAPMPAEELFKVGDVVSLGPHPSVPSELVGKFFRVKRLDSDGSIVLSLPFEDPACTVRYYSAFGLATSAGYRQFVLDKQRGACDT